MSLIEGSTAPLSLWRGDILVHMELPKTMAQIVRDVAFENNLTVEQLKGPSRSRAIAWPRQEAMWRCRQIGKSYPQIGRFFGGRDHTTAIHAIREVERRASTAMGVSLDNLSVAVADAA